MSNKNIARILQKTADLIELTGGNPYRARAFARASRTLDNLDEPVVDRLKAGTLTDIRGIGDAMADHVADIVQTGSFDLHDELLNAVPPGLLDVLRVKGLGTKRTRQLWTELEVTSLDDLEQAAEENRISELDGFGRKTQEKIIQNVRQLRRYEAQWHYAKALTTAQSVLSYLHSVDAVHRVEPTGALRRKMETVRHIDLLVATRDPQAVEEVLTTVLSEAPTREEETIIGPLQEGLPLRVHLTDPSSFGTAWWRTTGSSDHRETYEERYGSPPDLSDEEAVFEAANLPPIPPELRENQGELEAASQNALPSLLTVDDLEGCLHNHSTYSDGSDTLRAMAEAARERGFSYFAICDHSQSLRIADGLLPDEVRQQQAEIEQLNDEFATEDGSSFRIFSGIESDILRDGSLDYDEEILATFDLVVASVHTGFSMTEEEATTRLIRAIQNPYTHILGHPTGRLLLRREGYPIDHARVIEACAEQNVAIELNGNPYRLDLDWRWIQYATERGVLISINPDAHSTGEVQYVQWGVAVGRKGWLTPSQCLNAKSLKAFTAWLEGASPS